MQAGTHSGILSKSGNGRHVYVRVATPTHVTRGRKTLHVYGFTTNMGSTIFNSKVFIKILALLSSYPHPILHAHIKIMA